MGQGKRQAGRRAEAGAEESGKSQAGMFCTHGIMWNGAAVDDMLAN